MDSKVDIEAKEKSSIGGFDASKKSKVSLIASKSGMRSAVFGQRSMSRMKVRKQSHGFSGVPGIRNVETMSQLGVEYRRPVLMYLNTYQLDPRVRFDPHKVTKAAQEVIQEHFTDYKYHTEIAPEVALRVSSQLMRTVKEMKFDRYRIITVVNISQKRAQSYTNAVAFLWDHERDYYINIYTEMHTAFIQVTVFGIYLD